MGRSGGGSGGGGFSSGGRSSGGFGGGGFSSGGGRSSGGFGGSRSSGGFSGGGRNSGGSSSNRGSSSNSGGGGFFSNPKPSTSHPNNRHSHDHDHDHDHRHNHSTHNKTIFVAPPPRFNTYDTSSAPMKKTTGCLPSGCFIPLIIFVALIVFITMLGYSSSESSGNSIKRTPLSGQVHKTEWFQDNIGWVSNKSVLIQGLEEFYKKTGVQPFVLFVPYDETFWNEDGSINGNATDEYLENFYTDNFTDEAHFIFSYFAIENDDLSEMDGEFRYLSGYSTDTIMDSEAIRIFWGYFQTNYNDLSLTMEAMIANTFISTSQFIMSEPKEPPNLIGNFILMLLIIAIIIIITKIMKRRKEKEEYTKEILSKPLETFGNNDDTSELEKKYE